MRPKFEPKGRFPFCSGRVAVPKHLGAFSAPCTLELEFGGMSLTLPPPRDGLSVVSCEAFGQLFPSIHRWPFQIAFPPLNGKPSSLPTSLFAVFPIFILCEVSLKPRRTTPLFISVDQAFSSFVFSPCPPLLPFGLFSLFLYLPTGIPDNQVVVTIPSVLGSSSPCRLPSFLLLLSLLEVQPLSLH